MKISFNNVKFKTKLFGKDDIYSFSFDTGVHETTNKDLFNFLTFTSPELVEGEFFINEELFYPNDDENKDSLIVIKVNSTSLVIYGTFRVNTDNKKEKLDNIRTKLIELKSIVPSSNKEHEDKFIKIVDVLRSEEVIYLVINKLDKVNKEHADYIYNESNYTDLLVFIYHEPVIEKKPKPVVVKEKEIVELDVTNNDNLNVTEVLDKKELEQEQIKYIYEDGFLMFFEEKSKIKLLFNFIIKNARSYVFIFLPVLCLTASSLFLPYYFEKENFLVGTFLIIGFVICTALYAMFEYSCFDFLKHKNDVAIKEKFIFSLVGHYLYSLVGTALGVGLFFLMSVLNESFKETKLDIKLFILLFICVLIIALTPLIVWGVRKVLPRLLKKER